MTFFRLRDDKSDYDLYETPPVDFIPDSDIGFYATQYDANDLATCYANGFFPWPSPSHPVIPFYCPRKRFVLRPADLHVSHSLRRTIAKRTFTIHCDTAFCDVIVQCATTARRHEAGTWITNDYIDAFCDLHDRGIAHSVEAYDDDGTLCGGFYGTCMGRIFGGESMFTRISDSAKVAFVHFVQRARDFGFQLIDCQDYTPNMKRYGATMISRSAFLQALATFRDDPVDPDMWKF